MKFLEENLVAFQTKAKTPEEAIKKAGELLAHQGYITENYIEQMVQSFRKNGPYFVLAPHIALPHARPEDGVNEASVSMIQLKDAIKFGNSENDPVKLVFALGASDSNEHLVVLKKLMSLLSKKEAIDALMEANSYKDIKHLVQKEEE